MRLKSAMITILVIYNGSLFRLKPHSSSATVHLYNEIWSLHNVEVTVLVKVTGVTTLSSSLHRIIADASYNEELEEGTVETSYTFIGITFQAYKELRRCLWKILLKTPSS